jgi:hypothetical protein
VVRLVSCIRDGRCRCDRLPVPPSTRPGQGYAQGAAIANLSLASAQIQDRGGCKILGIPCKNGRLSGRLYAINVEASQYIDVRLEQAVVVGGQTVLPANTHITLKIRIVGPGTRPDGVQIGLTTDPGRDARRASTRM